MKGTIATILSSFLFIFFSSCSSTGIWVAGQNVKIPVEQGLQECEIEADKNVSFTDPYKDPDSLGNRRKYIDSCMQGKGFVFQSKGSLSSEEALLLKREEGNIARVKYYKKNAKWEGPVCEFSRSTGTKNCKLWVKAERVTSSSPFSVYVHLDETGETTFEMLEGPVNIKVKEHDILWFTSGNPKGEAAHFLLRKMLHGQHLNVSQRGGEGEYLNISLRKLRENYDIAVKYLGSKILYDAQAKNSEWIVSCKKNILKEREKVCRAVTFGRETPIGNAMAAVAINSDKTWSLEFLDPGDINVQIEERPGIPFNQKTSSQEQNTQLLKQMVASDWGKLRTKDEKEYLFSLKDFKPAYEILIKIMNFDPLEGK